MAEVKTTVTLKNIQEVVRQIVERFHPQKVILIGSYAYGQPTPDSDVDLLVVMETGENPLHTAAHIAASLAHCLPMDILVFQPADWEEYLREGAIFATHVATKGLVLYEASDPRVD